MPGMTWKKVLLLASGSVVVITMALLAWLFTANLGIFKSSIEVVRVILSPRMPISARTVAIECGMPEPLEQALYFG